MTISDENLEEVLRRIIREEVRPIVREEVRNEVRDQTQDLRDDIKPMKSMMGGMSLQLKHLQSGMNLANNSLRSHSKELLRLDVLLEDLNDRFSTARELRWD